MGDLADGGPGDDDIGDRGDLNPAVVVDFGQCGSDRGHQCQGMALIAADRSAGQHQQVGAVAAQSGREVVEPEERVEALRLLFVALKGVDQRNLLIDQ